MRINQKLPSEIFDDFERVQQSINYIYIIAKDYKNDLIPDWAQNLTLKELEERIEELKKENMFVYTLNMIASVEGLFNYQLKYYKNNRTNDPWVKPLISKFRNDIMKNNYIKFERILDEWKKYDDDLKPKISKLKEYLNYRHWLAHGRHWSYKSGNMPDIYEIYALYTDLNCIIRFNLKK